MRGAISRTAVVHNAVDPLFTSGDGNAAAITLAQALQRGFVAVERLPADRDFEWRGITGGLVFRQRECRRASRRAPQRITQPVAKRFADVGAESLFVFRCERIELTYGTKERVLNDVFSVQVLASPDREAAVRPASEARQVSRAELVARVLIAVARAEQQRLRGLRVRVEGDVCAGGLSCSRVVDQHLGTGRRQHTASG